MTNQTQHQGQSHQARAFNAPLAYADYKAKYAAFLVAAVTIPSKRLLHHRLFCGAFARL